MNLYIMLLYNYKIIILLFFLLKNKREVVINSFSVIKRKFNYTECYVKFC